MQAAFQAGDVCESFARHRETRLGVTTAKNVEQSAARAGGESCDNPMAPFHVLLILKPEAGPLRVAKLRAAGTSA
jgi:hypothetical protein